MTRESLRIFRPEGDDGRVSAAPPRPPLARLCDGFRDGLEACRRGLRDTKRGLRRWRRSLRGRQPAAVALPADYLQRVALPADRALAPRVVIIAETSILQCTKYRVVQKREAFRRLGIPCTTLSWTDVAACRDALQSHSLAIFYRVPAREQVLGLIAEARRLRVRTLWESDDLIFDAEVLHNSRAVARLDPGVVRGLLEGADLYRRAMLACDGAIASTPGLAAAMGDAGVEEVHVVENGLDEQTLDAAAAALDRCAARPADGLVRIVYGSGTDTHDVDFEVAAPAVARVLDRFPEARFRLIGPVALPECLERHADRIERLPLTDYATYLGLLAECDVSIAPLEDYVFNDAKSNIKFLEAAAVGVAAVCSPRAAFRGAITHGLDGLLCTGDAEWEEALMSLVASAGLRRCIAAAARSTVNRSYAPARIARRQVAPLITDRRGTAALRVLSTNVFYRPRSFGGATVVAENVNRLLRDRHGMDVHAFTTVGPEVAAPYTLHRYDTEGMNVFGMGLPDGLHDEAAGFDNPDAVRCFAEALDAVQPDVVHFHCVQGIGVGALEHCRDRGIPYAVTLHDAWWLCGRQFMIDRRGRYCDQRRIDLAACGSCIGDRSWAVDRSRRARRALEGAALLLTPSRFFADFHVANGLPDVRVNRNGITPPIGAARTRRPGRVRLGYVGGNTSIKGFHLVRDVFARRGDLPASLVLVDNTLNLGFRSYKPKALRGLRDVRVVPAYTQETIDDCFAEIDVLLFPTQWKESFGLTVREAIARNVWVIATDAGGVVEDIRPGRNGSIVPFRDDGTALEQAIVEAVEMFDRIPTGAPVAFDSGGIRFWDEQAAELAGMLHGCVPAACRAVA